MTKQPFVLAIITARGGSKGLPGKNIKPLAGKPLLAWTIEAARQSRYITRLILSSDDADIIRTAQAWGCEVPFVRPPELATDQSSAADAIIHAMSQLPRHDFVVILQPTSPLRQGADIDACLELCLTHDAQAAVSVKAASDKPPYWHCRLGAQHQLEPLFPELLTHTNRQALPPTYLPNGAVYVSRWQAFLERKTCYHEQALGYVMPEERSVDIDTQADFNLAEQRLRQHLAHDVTRQE